jgi:hypothetical protein
LIWQRRLGATRPFPPESPDVDYSGVVDAGDLAVWTRQFGQGVTLDFDWINSSSPPAGLASAETPASEPALAANVILSLNLTTPAKPSRNTSTLRPQFRPLLTTTAAHDAALVTIAAELIPAPRSAASPRTAGTDEDAIPPELVDDAFAGL